MISLTTGGRPGPPYRVAVLAGGDSSEREISLASGIQVAAALRCAGHHVELIDPAHTPLHNANLARFDGCFLALHGGEGEDGRLQQELADRGVPFTGSGPTASRLAMSKSAAKGVFVRLGVPTPQYVVFEADQQLDRIIEKVRQVGFPLVIKPDGQGSSLGVGLARSVHEVPARLADARRYDRLLLAERYIEGREFTVAVLGRKTLPVLEIIGRGQVFDYHSKYASQTIQYQFEIDLPPMKVEEIARTAVDAAAALGTAGLVRVDLVLDEFLNPWVLEINTLPGMTEHSMAPKAAARAGMDMPALCDWILREGFARTAPNESSQERPPKPGLLPGSRVWEARRAA